MMLQSRPIHVLLIEDNPGDVRLMQEAFKDIKIATTLSVTTDGEEAVQYLRKETPFASAQTPDFILLDLNLPKRDGREVLRIIKSDPEMRVIPVVILTTSNAEQDILHSYNLHVNSYINKPVDFDKFFDIVQKIEHFWLSTAILPTMLR